MRHHSLIVLLEYIDLVTYGCYFSILHCYINDSVYVVIVAKKNFILLKLAPIMPAFFLSLLYSYYSNYFTGKINWSLTAGLAGKVFVIDPTKMFFKFAYFKFVCGWLFFACNFTNGNVV